MGQTTNGNNGVTLNVTSKDGVDDLNDDENRRQNMLTHWVTCDISNESCGNYIVKICKIILQNVTRVFFKK